MRGRCVKSGILVWVAGLSLAGLVWPGCNGDSVDSAPDDAAAVWADQGGPGAEVGGESDVSDEPDVAAPSCTSLCGFVTQKQCSSATAYQECQPEGVCLAWGAEVACDEGEVCEDGECLKAFGDLDCIAVSKCIAGCQQDEACQDDCVLQGSKQGQADFEAFVACTDTNCGALFEQEKLAAGSSCTLESCKNEYLVCIEVGDADWGETLQCMQGCNEDAGCIGACVTKADFDALVKLTDILVCFEEKCPDPATWEQCATSQCLLQSMACL